MTLKAVAPMSESPAPTTRIPLILIVDDDEPTANALAKVFGAANFRTAICLRGEEAVSFVHDHPIDAAVVDIHLPDISGLVVTQKLRERFGHAIPNIVFSGDTSMETLNALPQVGATYFFSKPVNSSHLVQRMKEWIANPTADG
jgi:DNA-binding response OmpR family regulator